MVARTLFSPKQRQKGYCIDSQRKSSVGGSLLQYFLHEFIDALLSGCELKSQPETLIHDDTAVQLISESML